MTSTRSSEKGCGIVFLVMCVWLYLLCFATSAAHAWSYQSLDVMRGVCMWNNFVQQCSQPPHCVSEGFSPPTSFPPGQFSPISFSTDVLSQAGESTMPDICVARKRPLVQSVDLITGAEITEAAPSIQSSTVRVERTGGGVVVARCTDYNPLFVRLQDCDPSKKSKAPLFNFPPDTMFEVTDIYFYNGVLHRWSADSESLPTVMSLEVELHLLVAKPSVKSDPKSDVDDKIYTSQCVLNRHRRQHADLIVTMYLDPTEAQLTVNVSVVTRVVDGIVTAANNLAAGNGVVIELNDDINLFPFDVTNTVNSSLYDYVAYSGSLCQPPCNVNIPRLLLTNPTAVPYEVTTLLDTASQGVAMEVADMSYAILPDTLIYTGHLRQLPTSDAASSNNTNGGDGNGSDDGSDNEKSVVKSVVLPLLIVVDCILLFYIVILLFARIGWVPLPTQLGGLNHPVQFYARAYDEVENLEKAGLLNVVNSENDNNSMADDLEDEYSYEHSPGNMVPR